VRDLEAIDEPDGAYDVVLCREGLMFVPDPARAAAEIARVLRPGGRAAIAVWAARERNPWLGLVLDAVTEQTGTPVPPPGVPGPFSLADPDGLVRLLSDAGLADITLDEIPVPLRARRRSTSGGRGRRRSPGRSRSVSPPCPTTRRARSASGRAAARRRTRRAPGSTSPA
jgi:SAM-dependent methyltransferase